jgi:SAM-dependent methyltransferase
MDALRVCGSDDKDLLYQQRFAPFAAGSIGDGYDVVACVACGMCFATGLPDATRFAQYYADSSKYDLGGNGAELSIRDIGRCEDQATFVAAHTADRTLPVLDVGTATGGFLKALRDTGFEELSGVDPSPDAVRFARDVFGLDVAAGGLEVADKWGRKFGLVSYVAVLEHVLEPRPQVRAVRRLLQSGGLLYVCVPDGGAFWEHVEASFQEFSVEHINYFTARSLENAMAAEGFSLIAERSIVLRFGSDGRGPALEAIYRWDGTPRKAEPDRSGADRIREYVRGSAGVEADLLVRIARLADSGERIYVWGTGTYTLHLLETSRLGQCQIAAAAAQDRFWRDVPLILLHQGSS